MKKKFLALIFCILMIFSLTACAKNAKVKSTLQEIETTVSSAAKAQFRNIEEYFSNPQVKAEMDKAIAAQTEFTIDIVAKGNECIYSYYLTQDISDFDRIKAQLEENIRNQQNLIQNAANQLRLFVQEPNVKLTYKYFTKDGKFIASVSLVSNN